MVSPGLPRHTREFIPSLSFCRVTYIQLNQGSRRRRSRVGVGFEPYYAGCARKISNKVHILLLSYFSCISYRREPFIKMGGFREDLNACKDYDLALRLSKHGKTVFTDHITIYMSPCRLRKWTYLGCIARYLKYLLQYHLIFNLTAFFLRAS